MPRKKRPATVVKPMKVYPIKNKEGQLHAFEIDNFKVGRSRTTEIVRKIHGAKILRKPKRFLSWFREEVFCEFELNGVVFQIDEPYGDNSRYWIGKKEEGGWCEELETVMGAFQEA